MTNYNTQTQLVNHGLLGAVSQCPAAAGPIASTALTGTGTSAFSVAGSPSTADADVQTLGNLTIGETLVAKANSSGVFSSVKIGVHVWLLG
jgi:hypothetical protein